MASGELVVFRNAEMTFRRFERPGLLLALARGDDLAQLVGLGIEVEAFSRCWIAAAPMSPSEKYLPNRSRIHGTAARRPRGLQEL